MVFFSQDLAISPIKCNLHSKSCPVICKLGSQFRLPNVRSICVKQETLIYLPSYYLEKGGGAEREIIELLRRVVQVLNSECFPSKYIAVPERCNLDGVISSESLLLLGTLSRAIKNE